MGHGRGWDVFCITIWATVIAATDLAFIGVWGGTGKTVNDKGTRDALTTAAQKRHIDEFGDIFFLAIYANKTAKEGGRKQGALKGQSG